MEKAIYLDVDLCSVCGTCAVVCTDQNDIYPEKGQPVSRRIYQIEGGEFPQAGLQYVSAACLHCQDSPCVLACPTEAITRDNQTGAVMMKKELCIRCRSCARACRFGVGVPRYDQDEKIKKCNLCAEKVEAGLEPACVSVCPMGALKFEPANKVQDEKKYKFVGNMVSVVHKTISRN